MGYLHRAFLLNAVRFMDEITPVLASLDAGDAQPLYEQALAITQRTSSSHWILRLAGANLLDIQKVDSTGRPWAVPIENHLKDVAKIPSYEIGYWLLLIFSNFVQRCIGIGYDYQILEGVLRLLGWEQEKRKLLFEGEPTSTLLKPNATSISTISSTDPYWYWMIPTHSKNRGWLSQRLISTLHHQLLMEKETIQYFAPKHFGEPLPGFWLAIPEPEGQQYYYERLQIAFKRAIKMLEECREAKTELFMTISYS